MSDQGSGVKFPKDLVGREFHKSNRIYSVKRYLCTSTNLPVYYFYQQINIGTLPQAPNECTKRFLGLLLSFYAEVLVETY